MRQDRLPCFVINLPSDTQRKTQFQETNPKFTGSFVHYHFIDAVYGKDVPDTLKQKLCSPWWVSQMMTDGALGCALSHIKTLTTFVEHYPNDQVALIMEDDTLFFTDAVPCLQSLIALITSKQVDIIQLEKLYLVHGKNPYPSMFSKLYFGISNVPIHSMNTTPFAVYRLHKRFVCTGAYLISKQTAVFILNQFHNTRCLSTLDTAIYTNFLRKFPHDFKVGILFPPVCNQNRQNSHMKLSPSELGLSNIISSLPLQNFIKQEMWYTWFYIPGVKLPFSLGTLLIGLFLASLPKLFLVICTLVFFYKACRSRFERSSTTTRWNIVYTIQCITLLLSNKIQSRVFWCMLYVFIVLVGRRVMNGYWM